MVSKVASLIFTREDLKSIFDENIEAIFALIKDQVKELQQVHPKEHVVRTSCEEVLNIRVTFEPVILDPFRRDGWLAIRPEGDARPICRQTRRMRECCWCHDFDRIRAVSVCLI